MPLSSKKPTNTATLPSAEVRANVWEGTCAIDRPEAGTIRVRPGSGAWWGCGLEIQGKGTGENLSNFAGGKLHFEIRGKTKSTFDIGFQTGLYSDGSQTNNYVRFGPDSQHKLTAAWKKYSIPVAKLSRNARLKDVTAPLYLRGESRADDQPIEVRNIHWTQK